MKKIIYSIFLITLVSVFSSCEKDLMEEVNEGNWNSERNIIDFGLKQQIGLARIERSGNQATINITINASNLDLAAVDITDMVLSYDAQANVTRGDKLNFDNPENKSTVMVTSKKGETLEWTIFIEPFINELEGSWAISSYSIKWDDGNGWGNAGESELSDLLTESSSGLDDIITIGAVKGANDEGLVYGDYERTMGEDGLAASYIYARTSEDWAVRFNQLPIGSGEWILNKDNSVTFVVNKKSYTTKTFDKIDETILKLSLDPGVKELGRTNWDDYYGDNTNKFVAATDLWYTLTKQ
ncbi:hypothetical protein [Polaribacter sp. Q13]|uniref:hypothetical protein n=1 Tax=Polaribacter sp. Q13 TaxID=2806551 RepID=UPI00193B5C78|nr:hypothetical protein [Polaribacter sp. Q13]QVY66157.1 hypothetical protein JOP69_02365 [Polaribacter sp. Q13]